jgi:ribonuclease HI
MDEVLNLDFDGGSRGNPGPAGIGVVVRAADRTPLVTLGRYVGRATNNVAEYKALITVLREAKKLGAKRIHVKGDSELIIRQMKGEYRVKSEDLRPLFEEASQLVDEFEQVRFEHNLRGHNALADKLANLAMDKKGDVTEADGEQTDLESPSPRAATAGDKWTCHRCGCVVMVQRPSSIRPHQLKPFVCQCGMKMEAER